MECTKKNSASYGWQGVLIGRDLLKGNLGWVVGDGKSIPVWYSPWLSLEDQEGIYGPAREADINLTVAELFQQETNEWDDEKIQNLLPHLKEKIKTIKPSLSGTPDKRVWLGTSTGEYTTKSGYKVAIKFREEEAILGENHRDLDWFKNVWKLNTSPKVKLFLWKVFQNAIPVKELLAIRITNIDTRCKRCNTPESIDHLFLHCPYARKVWEAIPVTPTVNLSGSIDLSDVWLNLCAKTCLPPTGLAGHLAPWIMWQLWMSRNSLCFSNKNVSEEETIARALQMAREWTNAQEKQPTMHRAPAAPAPKPLNCTLVRTDAAWKASLQTAGLGWIIGDRGEIATSFSTAVTVRSALTAEGLAMRQALNEAYILGVKRLVVESDSSQLIKALNGDAVPLELYGIAADILNLALKFDFIFFCWIPRDDNSVADSLAKQGLVLCDILMAIT